MSESSNNKRIAKNTILLYFRMIFVMTVNIFTSRVILQALGVDDFGIYNVVGGFVAMFSLVSGSLSAAIQRFITYELGGGDKERLAKVFSSSVTIQLIISLIIVVLVEIIGVWFIYNKMTISPERITAAHIILQFSVLTFCVNLISVPYNAAIVAHEKMSAFAYVSILDTILKLSVCYVVMVSPFDHLISYAALLCCVSILIRFIYGVYCKRHFYECTYHFCYDKQLLYKMFAFSGWNFIGAGAGILRDQGVNILLNIFWGTTVNAARGIAMQVSAAVTSFSSSFITALNPQITKNYATNNNDYAFKLVMRGSCLSFYLLLLISLPILCETDIVLRTWLTVVPDYTSIFVRLVIIYVMTESISNPMITLMLATGKIRNYQLVVGGCQLMNFPISYVLLKLGYQPYWTMVVAMVIAFICLFVRMYMLHKMVGFPMGKYLKMLSSKVLIVGSFSIILPISLIISLPESYMRLFMTSVVAVASTLLSVFYLGSSKGERDMILSKARNFIQSKRKK